MKAVTLLFLSLGFVATGWAQEAIHLPTSTPEVFKDNITVEKLSTDANQSSFLIWVKDTVRPHHHAEHTECIYVLEGEGTFYLGTNKMELKPGDYVRIPQGVVHSFKTRSPVPAKVLSIQTPEFLGEDRIWSDHQH
ncbi:cupin domain-containing protein [bacterium SCSIO 12741]|nr:cupin domain-containing protein [bacterium SCSIO 12741]